MTGVQTCALPISSDDVSPHTYEYELDKSTGEVVKVNSKRLTDAFNGH